MTFFSLFLTAALFSFTLMLLVWLLSLKIRNAGIVDVAWAGGFGLLAVLYAAAGSGAWPRRLMIGAMVLIWSLRLTTHLWRRVKRLHPREDSRYEEIRRRWKTNLPFKFFIFFQGQALILFLLSLPILLICVNTSPRIHLLEGAALGLWALALFGESLADAQLARFKADPENKGKVCRTGLWDFSRHPNYFFEWLVWVAYFLFALASPWGGITVYAPLGMLYLLLFVSGIPPSEESALKSKGEAFREYQRTTGAFIPWFKKKAP